MRRSSLFLISSLLLGLPAVSVGDPVPPSWNHQRLRGFAEHKKDGKIYDREREKGRTAYLEELEQWEQARLRAVAEHKKRIKELSPQEGGPEYREDRAQKRKIELRYETLREEYVAQKNKLMARQQADLPVSQAEELGLNEKRPRFDYKKRVLYGAPAKFKTGSTSGGSGGRYVPPPSPPPVQDDFPPMDPYIPPPISPEDETDFPPPPPPPPMPFDDGSGDFTPPGFGDFPPPPTGVPEGF